jgi:hypothetical protein
MEVLHCVLVLPNDNHFFLLVFSAPKMANLQFHLGGDDVTAVVAAPEEEEEDYDEVEKKMEELFNDTGGREGVKGEQEEEGEEEDEIEDEEEAEVEGEEEEELVQDVDDLDDVDQDGDDDEVEEVSDDDEERDDDCVEVHDDASNVIESDTVRNADVKGIRVSREKLFKVQYEDYHRRILKPELRRLLRKSYLYDVVFICRNSVAVPASSLVLGSMSSFLAGLLADVPIVDRFKTVLVPDLIAADVELFTRMLFNEKGIGKASAAELRRIRMVAAFLR